MQKETRPQQLNRYLNNVRAAIDALINVEEQRQGLSDAMRVSLNELRRDENTFLELLEDYELCPPVE